MAASSLRLGALVIDPARCKELINPEFAPDGSVFVVSNDRCEIGGEYGALPASVADNPSAIGVFFGQGELAATALVALTWDGDVLHFERLPSSVDARTTTVADREGEAIALPKAPVTQAEAA